MSTIDEAVFGTLLRQYRVAAGLSQEALAERAHMSARGISDLERGVRRTPYQGTVVQLAQALELDDKERARLVRAAGRNPTLPSEVDTVLVATKLTAPLPRSSLVDRTRLLELVGQGVRGSLTLISAPPGSGKTTLLSVWQAARARDTSTAWVSLDAGDNDAARCWRYVVAALDRAGARIGPELHEMLRAPQPPVWRSVVTLLINDLAPLPDDILLVLDDYHVIENEDIHKSVRFLVEHVPPRLHLLIASRTDPPLPLPRLRAAGKVTEIRLGDLRFTTDEAATFLTVVMGLSLSSEDVKSLEARTEGWIAGLQLAALSLQGLPSQSIQRFIRDFTGSHRYVVDYLIAEVLLRQPEGVQHFLLSTSILDRLSAPLCAAVLHGGAPTREQVIAAQDMLERLERQNLFLVALDGRRDRYRYHHLFAETLRLREEMQGDDVARLHRRAAEWYAGENELSPAIGHALAAHDHDLAGDLVVHAAPVSFGRGELDTLMGWLGTLPDSVVRARPRLCTISAMARIDARDPDGADGYLRSAEAHLETQTAEEQRHLRADIGVARSNVYAMRGDATAVIPQIESVRKDIDPERTTTRGLAAMSIGFATLYQGRPLPAAEAFREAVEIHRSASNPYAMLLAAMGESYSLRAGGALGEAIDTCRTAIRWSEERSHPSTMVSTLYAGYADLLRERNELEGAFENARRAVEISMTPAQREGRWLEWRLFSDLVLARVSQARGDLAGALEILATGRARLEGVWTACAVLFDAFEAQIHLMQGKVDAAERWLRSREGTRTPHLGLSPQFYVYAYEHLTVAPIQVGMALVREGGDRHRLDPILDMLTNIRLQAERAGLPWLRLKELALRAMVTDEKGNGEEALPPLQEAIQLARPGGYARVFLDEGPPITSLLRRLGPDAAGQAHTIGLLEGLETQPGETPRRRI